MPNLCQWSEDLVIDSNELYSLLGHVLSCAKISEELVVVQHPFSMYSTCRINGFWITWTTVYNEDDRL